MRGRGSSTMGDRPEKGWATWDWEKDPSDQPRDLGARPQAVVLEPRGSLQRAVEELAAVTNSCWKEDPSCWWHFPARSTPLQSGG